MDASEVGTSGEVTRAYAPVNGLQMYYESHGAVGAGGTGCPLVLLHGGLMTIDATFAGLLPALAARRRVIAVEQQGHGRTADVDRPLTYSQMADDTVALLRHLGIERADFFGFSDGGIVALGIAIRQPAIVRRLAVAGANFDNDGLYPEVVSFMKQATPEDMGTELPAAYAKVAPRPEAWPALVAKAMTMAVEFEGWRRDDLQAIAAPALVIAGDSDTVRPEHAVELFRLLGGGVAGDFAGLPRAQLAVLPGTTHLTLLARGEWLSGMVLAFLDLPAPAGA